MRRIFNFNSKKDLNTKKNWNFFIFNIKNVWLWHAKRWEEAFFYIELLKPTFILLGILYSLVSELWWIKLLEYSDIQLCFFFCIIIFINILVRGHQFTYFIVLEHHLLLNGVYMHNKFVSIDEITRSWSQFM